MGMVALFGGLALEAFPPAPYYTIYGDVRDAYGNLLPAEGSAVVIYKGGQEVLRQSLTSADDTNYNYQVRLRIDMMRAATSHYSSLAMNPGAAYTVAISVGGQIFHPLELTASPQVGDPAERHRIDLTLGVDSDGDTLPDLWEESQLYEAGYSPGPDGWDLSLIDRDSDYDDDGVSNWAEYVASTYATDPAVLELQVKEFLAGAVRLEFYAIYGRSYRLESSTTLEAWEPAPISATEGGLSEEAQSVLRPETTGVTSIYTPYAGSRVFYRLIAE